MRTLRRMLATLLLLAAPAAGSTVANCDDAYGNLLLQGNAVISATLNVGDPPTAEACSRLFDQWAAYRSAMLALEGRCPSMRDDLRQSRNTVGTIYVLSNCSKLR